MYNIDVVPMVKSSLNVEPSSRHEVNNTGTDNDTEPVLKRFVYFKMRSIPRFMKVLFMTDAFDGFDFSPSLSLSRDLDKICDRASWTRVSNLCFYGSYLCSKACKT